MWQKKPEKKDELNAPRAMESAKNVTNILDSWKFLITHTMIHNILKILPYRELFSFQRCSTDSQNEN